MPASRRPAAPPAVDLAAEPSGVELADQPGHLIRRAHQIAVSVFLDKVGDQVTPVQYAVLRMLQSRPGLDQKSLAEQAGLDTSTAADIAVRLENKGWIVREMLPRRQRRLLLTPEGEAVLARTVPGVAAMLQTLFDGFEPREQQDFMRLLRKFVHLGNEHSRAPMRPGQGDDADTSAAR